MSDRIYISTVVLKVGGIAPLGARGEQNKRATGGAKLHKGGENAQPLPLIDHWVKFSSYLNALKAKKLFVDS